jgi:hypothetical protein
MPDNRRNWTEEDIAKLKSMAGKLSLVEIATRLGRTTGATALQASKLKISLRRDSDSGRARTANSGASLDR